MPTYETLWSRPSVDLASHGFAAVSLLGAKLKRLIQKSFFLGSCRCWDKKDVIFVLVPAHHDVSHAHPEALRNAGSTKFYLVWAPLIRGSFVSIIWPGWKEH